MERSCIEIFGGPRNLPTTTVSRKNKEKFYKEEEDFIFTSFIHLQDTSEL